MTSEEKQLITNLVETVKAISSRQDSFLKDVEKRFSRELQQFKAETDFLRELIEHFVKLLDPFEKLIHKIRTSFMKSRIWEELQEYKRDDSKGKHRSERTTGFDVERKLRQVDK